MRFARPWFVVSWFILRFFQDKAQNEKEEALHRCNLGASELARLREQLEDMETELTKKYKAVKELELLVEKLTEEKKILEEEKGHSDEAESYKGQLEEVQGLLVWLTSTLPHKSTRLSGEVAPGEARFDGPSGRAPIRAAGQGGKPRPGEE